MFFCLSLYFTFIYLYMIVIYILRLLYVIRVHILIVKYHRDSPKVFPSSQFYILPNNEKGMTLFSWQVVEKHKVYYLHITNHSTNKNVFTRNQHVAYIDKVIKVFRNTYSITVHQRNLKCLVQILAVLLWFLYSGLYIFCNIANVRKVKIPRYIYMTCLCINLQGECTVQSYLFNFSVLPIRLCYK